MFRFLRIQIKRFNAFIVYRLRFHSCGILIYERPVNFNKML